MSAQAPASTVARRIRADPANAEPGIRSEIVRRSAGASEMNNALAQAERLWANILALGAKRLAALAMIGLTVFAATGFSRLLSQPADHGNALFRAGSGRRGRHRVDAQGSGDRLRRVGRRRHRHGPGRSGGARAHDLGGERACRTAAASATSSTTSSARSASPRSCRKSRACARWRANWRARSR